MEYIWIISNVFMILGILMLITSIGLYIKRTGDKSVLTRFWASKTEFLKPEIIINRLGLALVIIGLALSFL